MTLKDRLMPYVLQNAVFYKGKANPNGVIGKVLGENPDLRNDANKVKKEVEKLVNEVNGLSLEEQKKKLEKIDPSLLKKEEKKQEDLLPLKDAKEGKVVTRFAPAPTGPLHISHLLRAVFLSYLYAKKYKGKFILRLDDTDLKKIKKEYYDWIKEDLKLVNVKWDKLEVTSDNMELFYQKIEELIKNTKAYVCFCPAEKFKVLKKLKKDCKCFKSESGLDDWKKMVSGEYKEGDCVVRLHTSMSHPNPALREPPIARIAEGEHPIQKNKYKAWPLYNFSTVVMDHTSEVTHIFRAKEHEHNTAVQKEIYTALGWEIPVVINFGMVYLPGEKIHTREIKEKINRGEFSGWDDPKLPTIKALIRRGFQPEAFERASITCGLSKSDIRFSWENLYGINGKVLDPKVNRYMVVLNPVEISVSGLKKKEVSLMNHPEFLDRGSRKVKVSDKIFVAGIDFEKFSGTVIRLKELGNVEFNRESKYIGDEIDQKMQKIQWVSEPNVKVKIITTDGDLEGLGEPSLTNLKVGDIIQMERVGFGRIDSKTKDSVTIVYGHR